MTPLLATLVSALVAAATAAPEDCGLPKARGSCSQFAVRHYYDTEYGGCLRFWYGGCDGNGNRFDTEAECERACVSPPGDQLCRLPAVRGACKRAKTRWYSDPAAGGCRQFTYSGCLGNDNRFESEEACRQRCGGVSPGAVPEPDAGGGPVVPDRPAPGPADCLLPDRVAGDCSQYVIRYSYVAARQQCAPFYYGGCGGNANRFDSAETCRAACVQPPPTRPPYYERARPAPQQPGVADRRDRRPEYGREDRPSPRKDDRPSYDREERPLPTEAPSAATPAAAICSLTPEPGRCRAYIPSYYFNAGLGRCVRFVYGGCEGNENRFSTLAECEKRCGQQAYSYDRDGRLSNTIEQDRPQPTEAPSFPYRPPGRVPPQPEPESPETPAPEVDICSLPSDPGRCRAYNPSYYFNAQLNRCLGFVYGGCEGNENRFSTLSECQERCGSQVQPSYANVGNRIEPTEAPSRLSPPETEAPSVRYQPETSAPPQTEQEPPTTPAPAVDICSLPSDTGRCRAYKPKYYFNAQLNRCLGFVYGGCGGNENRFSTIAECQQRCGGGQTAEAPQTEAPSETEPPATETEPLETETPTPDAYIPLPTAAQDVCQLPPTAGPCDQRLQRYYFNAPLGSCFSFTYGGCGGNGNRFSSAAECRARCLPGQPETTFAPFPSVDLGFGGGADDGFETTTTDYPTYDYEGQDYNELTGAGGIDTSVTESSDYYDEEYYADNYDYQ